MGFLSLPENGIFLLAPLQWEITMTTLWTNTVFQWPYRLSNAHHHAWLVTMEQHFIDMNAPFSKGTHHPLPPCSHHNASPTTKVPQTISYIAICHLVVLAPSWMWLQMKYITELNWYYWPSGTWNLFNLARYIQHCLGAMAYTARQEDWLFGKFFNVSALVALTLYNCC